MSQPRQPMNFDASRTGPQRQRASALRPWPYLKLKAKPGEPVLEPEDAPPAVIANPPPPETMSDRP